MSLTSLLNETNSWLNKWLRLNVNMAEVGQMTTEARQMRSEQYIAPPDNMTQASAMTAGMAMTYGVAFGMDPGCSWLATSPLHEGYHKQLKQMSLGVPIGHWALECAQLESSRRGGSLQSFGLGPTDRETVENDLSALCVNLSWLPQGVKRLKMHQTFYYSSAMGGADCQLAHEDSLIRVKTSKMGMVMHDMLKCLIYPALDTELKWENIVYILTRQQIAAQWNIKDLWKRCKFDLDKFHDHLDDIIESENDLFVRLPGVID